MSKGNKESTSPAPLSTPTSKESAPSKPQKRKLFGRTNKKERGEGTPPPDKPQRGKSFKRIMALFSRQSRKERRARKAQELAEKAGGAGGATSNKGVPEDDAETIYPVDSDERSAASRLMTSADGDIVSRSLLDVGKKDDNKKKSLQIVLLLVDPETRRFELLQVEVDSLEVLVSDVLAQIPLSVTEEVLRKQTYTGLCSSDGEEQPPSVLLAAFCRGNDVLAAVPTGLQAKECARLAKPILGDDKVIAMLASSGVDAKGWKDESKKEEIPKDSDPSVASLPKTKSGDDAEKETPKDSDRSVAVPPTTTNGDDAEKEVPKDSDPSVAQLPKTTSGDAAEKETPKDSDLSVAVPPTTTNGDGAKTTKPSTASTTNTNKSKRGSLAGLVAVAIIAILLHIVHLYLSAPIKPGQVVSPGIWLRRCGLKSLLPATCNNSYLQIDEHGVATIYASSYSVAARMEGAVCPVNFTGCVKGLQFANDTQVLIGGKLVDTIDMLQDIPLSPWPFSEPPKLTKLFRQTKKAHSSAAVVAVVAVVIVVVAGAAMATFASHGRRGHRGYDPYL